MSTHSIVSFLCFVALQVLGTLTLCGQLSCEIVDSLHLLSASVCDIFIAWCFVVISGLLLFLFRVNFLYICVYVCVCVCIYIYLICLIHFLFIEFCLIFCKFKCVSLFQSGQWKVSHQTCCHVLDRRTTCTYFKEWKSKTVPENKTINECSADVNSSTGKWNMYFVCVAVLRASFFRHMLLWRGMVGVKCFQYSIEFQFARVGCTLCVLYME